MIRKSGSAISHIISYVISYRPSIGPKKPKITFMAHYARNYLRSVISEVILNEIKYEMMPKMALPGFHRMTSVRRKNYEMLNAGGARTLVHFHPLIALRRDDSQNLSLFKQPNNDLAIYKLP